MWLLLLVLLLVLQLSLLVLLWWRCRCPTLLLLPVTFALLTYMLHEAGEEHHCHLLVLLAAAGTALIQECHEGRPLLMRDGQACQHPHIMGKGNTD